MSASIAVVGSVNADLYLRLPRLPLPGETLSGTGGQILPGGKGANQAVAAARLGGRVAMVGAVGSDAHTAAALSGLEDAGVDLEGLAHLEGPTGLAVVSVDDDGENEIIVVAGANGAVDAAFVQERSGIIRDAAVVVCQGEIPRSGTETAAAITSGRLLLNPAPVLALDGDVVRRADPLVVNEHEAAETLALLRGDGRGNGLAHESGDDARDEACGTSAEKSGGHSPAADPEEVVAALRAEGIASVVLTLGSAGSLVADHGAIEHVPAARVETVDTTGAGDAFIGALAVRLADGAELVEAARYAARVSAAAVTAAGAQPSYPRASDPLPELP